jgi:uncharacterized peroxidase-related enzyme
MTHHGAALHLLTKNESLVEQLKSNYKTANIEDRTKAMLEYAVKLTIKPSDVQQSDIDSLKNYEFEDRAILDICQIASYFNFVNRMAEGLGVRLEEEYK